MAEHDDTLVLAVPEQVLRRHGARILDPTTAAAPPDPGRPARVRRTCTCGWRAPSVPNHGCVPIPVSGTATTGGRPPLAGALQGSGVVMATGLRAPIAPPTPPCPSQ